MDGLHVLREGIQRNPKLLRVVSAGHNTTGQGRNVVSCQMQDNEPNPRLANYSRPGLHASWASRKLPQPGFRKQLPAVAKKNARKHVGPVGPVHQYPGLALACRFGVSGPGQSSETTPAGPFFFDRRDGYPQTPTDDMNDGFDRSRAIQCSTRLCRSYARVGRRPNNKRL